MFARVATYRLGSQSSTAVPDGVVSQVLAIDGCRGVYFLFGKDSDKGMSISLWDTEDQMVASRGEVGRIREEASRAQQLEVLSVEEYEVTQDRLRA